MTKKFFLFLVLGVPTVLFAQGVIDGSPNTYLNNYVQPAPDAASLGKYADFPISYYTGTPEINIPIYGLKDGAAKLPISLSYHASGIHLAEVATWVGLGWTLNAGGMIMRTVRGAPDEGTLKGYTSLALGPRGYYKDSGLMKLPLLAHPDANGNFLDNPSQMTMTGFTIPGIAAGALDCEPDLFTFNFDGYSGKFVFDEFKTPHLLTDDNLKIYVNYSGGLFTYWIITTPEGTKYYFGENNVQEITNPSSASSGSDPDAALPASWYLTKVVYPNTKDTIYLNYTAETYLYNDLGPESKMYNFVNYQGGPNLNSVCLNNPLQNMVKTTVTGYRLTNIKSKNYNVVFVADTSRQDLPAGGYTHKELDSIKINTTAGQCIKQFAFHYTYFQSTYTTACNWCNTQNPAWPIDSSDTRRLKLLSLKEVSGDGTMSKPPYQFIYQDTFQLPRRLSYDQDHWGFSNYSSGNNNPFFTPGVSFQGMSNCSVLADRTPKWPQMEAATLLSIRDPLGVTTKFEFEANSSYGYPVVGGLRVHRIIVTDSVTGIQNIRKFVYQGGVLFKIPNYLMNLQNEFYALPSAQSASPGYQGYNSATFNNIYVILKQSQSFIPLQDAQGNAVGYSSVTEIFGNNGEGGSTIHTYQMNLNPHGDSRLSLYNYASLQSVTGAFSQTINSLCGNGNFNNILPQNLLYATSYLAPLYYPIAPDQNDVTRGKLSNELTYDSSGNLLKSVYNMFGLNYHEYNWIRGLKAYQSPIISQPISTSIYPMFPSNLIAMTFYKLHTGISHLISTIETDYKDGKSMVTVHNFGYEDTLHTLQTSDTSVTSQGDSIIKKTYYSYDYANSATSDNVFGKMKARNLLLPVSTRLWKNNQLLSGTVTQYQDFASLGTDTFINPAKIFSFQTIVPKTSSQAGETIKFTSPWTTLLPNTSFIEKADFTISGTTGKIIQQKLVSDKDQALIWDNVYSLPLAQVDNAYFSDIAFNSFESAETGNWTYTAGSVVTDATAPTGTHAYTLSSSNPISKSSLNTTQTYVVSYWLKSGASASVSGGTQSGATTGRTLNNWTYHEVKVTGTTSLSITGTGNVDEVRLYPSTAQMTTYTYDALLRLIAECSANSTVSYYDYDSLNRVMDIRDQYGNVIKAFQYNYGRQSRSSQ
ncbi:MAG TPA: hypothetical protein VKR53_03055 [Puia sp.]|nr:hypothetical protein [Puia sp.]